MWRFLAGVGSALLLCAAGFVWWTSGSPRSAQLIASPGFAQAAESPEVDPPQADDKTREEKRFDRYDKDRDDIVTRDEYLASRVKAYARLDTNGDGRLSFEEWGRKTTDKFAKADGDRSGKLDRTEFATTRVIRRATRRADCPPAREDGEES